MNLPPHTHKRHHPNQLGETEQTIYTWTTPAGLWHLSIEGTRLARIDGPGAKIDRAWSDAVNELELTALLETVGAIEPDEPPDLSWRTYEPKLITRIHEHLDDNRAQWFGPGDRASTRDIAETMAQFIRDNFAFDGLEHDDWQPPTEDPLSVDEFFVAHGYRAVDGKWYASPVRVRRRAHHTGAWLSTTRSNTGAHMTPDEVRRTILALARAANINVHVDGIVYDPKTDEMEKLAERNITYTGGEMGPMGTILFPLPADMLKDLPKGPCPVRGEHIPHGWREGSLNAPLYHCSGDWERP